jgi:hypothetical protein
VFVNCDEDASCPFRDVHKRTKNAKGFIRFADVAVFVILFSSDLHVW